jgi:hypothetical protein
VMTPGPGALVLLLVLVPVPAAVDLASWALFLLNEHSALGQLVAPAAQHCQPPLHFPLPLPVRLSQGRLLLLLLLPLALPQSHLPRQRRPGRSRPGAGCPRPTRSPRSSTRRGRRAGPGRAAAPEPARSAAGWLPQLRPTPTWGAPSGVARRLGALRPCHPWCPSWPRETASFLPRAMIADNSLRFGFHKKPSYCSFGTSAQYWNCFSIQYCTVTELPP